MTTQANDYTKSDYGGRVRPSSPFKKRRKPTSFIYSKTRKFQPPRKPRQTGIQNLTEFVQEPLCDPCKARHDHATRYSARSTNTWAVGRCMIAPFLLSTSCISHSVSTSSLAFTCSPYCHYLHTFPRLRHPHHLPAPILPRSLLLPRR
jgi:hypothetical protein